MPPKLALAVWRSIEDPMLGKQAGPRWENADDFEPELVRGRGA